MMAEMEQRLLSQGGNRRGFNRDQFFARQPTEEADSDCSIDSADVSWQADLW